jgi:enoyl-CoA hydratase
MIEYNNILVSKLDNSKGLKIGLVEINRPKVLNALNITTVEEILDAFKSLDGDTEVGCMILTGNEKAFAAGADIKEMVPDGTIDMYLRDQFATWDAIGKIKKPIIAAVSGYALGGGCELSMTCDMIVAAESAKFGQPEIKLGIIPGAGGTQRLTHAVGKAKAMEMILTGRTYSAAEMFNAGLVNKITPDDLYMEEAIALAKEIASMPQVAVKIAKESILKSFSSTIDEGIAYERRNLYLLFSSEDKNEGMKAFIEKRPPNWKGK